MSHDIKIFKNGKTYFLEFQCENEDKAQALLGEIFRPDAVSRTEFETKFGIVTRSIGWVDWKQKCQDLKESFDMLFKGFL